jgi:hypothetical protein
MSFYKKVSVGIEFEFTVGVGSLGKVITAPGDNFYERELLGWP